MDYYLGDGRSRALPSIVNLNITTVCNLKCPFCFNNDILGKRKELSTEEMLDLVDQLAGYRSGLFLTGGEPFARKDIYEIIEHAKKRGMPVGCVTNATLFTEEKVKRLREIGLDVVIISFHGTEEAHDKAVVMKGAYKKTMAALDWFRKYWPAPGPMINYVITPESLPHLSDFMKELDGRDNVAVRLSHLNFVTPEEAEQNADYWMRNFGEGPDKLLHYQYEPSDGLYEPILRNLREHEELFTKPVLSENDMKNWYSPHFNLKRRCVFIWRSTYINSDGDVYPCQFLYIKMGSVKEKKIHEIWNGERYRRFRALLREGLTPGCSRCCKL
ncbi:MAG: radical SAM protein [Deltaproteobacteria bacterium]|nr:radical SAM protein [Deltaproteobacteria bacterium]